MKNDESASDGRPSAFEDVVSKELLMVNLSRQQRKLNPLTEIRFQATGLALSGGGIRAATFHLGFLQGLARDRLISHFDYLSAVSGGAYIAAWLGCLMRDRPPSDLSQLLDPSGKTKEPPEITHLRDYSNYLTPRLGLFSPHIWTLIATYLRNLLVTLLLVMLPVLALLLLPRLLGEFVVAGLAGGIWFWACEGVVLALMVVNIGKALIPFLTQRGRPLTDRGIFYSRACFGWLLGCLLLIGLTVHFHHDILDIVSTLRGEPSQIWFVGVFQTFEKMLGPPANPEDVWRRPLDWWQMGGLLVSAALLWITLPLFLQQNLERRVRASGLKIQRILMAGSALFLFAIFLHNRLLAIHDWVQSRFYAMDANTASITVTAWALPIFLSGSVFILALGDTMLFSILLQLKHPKTTRRPKPWFPFRARKQRNNPLQGKRHLPLCLRRIDLDLLQEHLSRTYGTVLIYAISSLAISVTAIYGPFMVTQALRGSSWIFGLSIWGMGSLLGLLLVFWPRLKQMESDWFMFWVGRILPYWFASVPILAASWLLHSLMLGFGTGDWSWYSAATRLTFNVRVLYYLLFICLFGHALASCAGVNRYSMHSFYRARLVQCYLLPRLMKHKAIADEDSAKFSGTDRRREGPKFREDLSLAALNKASENGGPLFLFNAALNISSRSRLAWQERKAVSFTMSSLYCGYSAEVSNTQGELKRIEAFWPTYEYSVENERISCGFAMATSGAAITPTMVFQGTPRFNVLMSILNLRLGVWVANPSHPISWKREMPRSLIHFLFAGVRGPDGARWKLYSSVRRRTL